MKKNKLLIAFLALFLLACIAIPTFAASSVKESDWISAPSNILVKCSGGSCDHTECDYVYSFAVVGDTQNLNYIDAENYAKAKESNPSITYETYNEAHMRTLYNWILNNKESKNIQYVMGLGDITQSFATSQTYYNDEWALAKSAISLLDGKLDYSLVRGNHDVSGGMNGAFGTGSVYYGELEALSKATDSEGRPMAGFLNSAKIEDTYRKVIIGDDKYIIFTLDYYPTEECVTWLNKILADNADYTAIVTLHAFINKDSTFVDSHETTTPAQDAERPAWAETATGGNVEPRVLWDDALSRHSNVKLILCGHVGVDDIVVNQLKGEKGNTVTCMLINGQNIDSSVEPVGLVTMFYMSADGRVMNVEHISTVREAADKNAYLRNNNQFGITLDYSDESDNGWTVTAYGDIPTDIYNANTFHVFLDDDGIEDNVSFHFGSYSKWEDTLNAIHAFNGIDGVETRKLKTYNILMSEDFTYTGDLAPNKSGLNPGKIILDINDKTLTLNSGVLFPYYNQRNTFEPTVAVKNGNVVMAGKGRIAVLQTSIEANGSVAHLNLEDLNITYNNANPSVVGMYGGLTGYTASVNVTVSGCSINTVGASGAVTLFNLQDAKNNNNAKLVFVGGSIIGKTNADTAIYLINSGSDSVFFDKDANDKYTTLTLDESSAPAGVFRNTDGDLLRFVTESAQPPYLFNLEKSPLEETPYGVIPTDIYPEATYPFVLFQNGEIVEGYKSWKEFCQSVYLQNTDASKNSVLYLRADHNSTEAASEELRNVKNLTLDLGGNVFTATGGCMFNFMASGNYDFTTDIKIVNGTVIANKAWAPLVSYNSKNTTDVDARFNLIFEGVTLKSSASFQGRLLAEAWKDGTDGTTNTITLNDCTIDATAGSVSAIYKLDESNNQNKVDVAIIINGGTLAANAYVKFGTVSAERDNGKGSPDTLTIGKGKSGNDFCLRIPSTVAHPMTSTLTTAGTLYPIEIADDGANADYAFKSITTKYGDIPEAYRSEVDYPFVLFQNGELVAGYKSWRAFCQNIYAQNTDASKNSVLYLRTDHNATETASNQLRNVKNITLDLGGNTFTASNGCMFLFMAEKNYSFTTNIKVINGTVIANHAWSPIISYNSQNTSAVDTGFNVTFENVTIRSSSSFKGRLLAEAWKDGTVGTVNTITLTNCIIDATGGNVSALFTLSESNNQNKVDVAVTINGGKMLFNSFSNFGTFSAERESGKRSPDTLTFGKYNGEYAVLSFKSGSVPATSFDTAEEGKAFFKASGSAGEYVLTPCAHAYDNGCDADCNICGAARTPAHDYSIIGRDADQHWRKCSACGAIDDGTKENHDCNEYGKCAICQVTFVYAAVKVGKDLSMIYTVDVLDSTILGEGDTLAVKFAKAGKDLGIFAAGSVADGRYMFTLNGIAPQEMTDALDAELVVVNTEGECVNTIAAYKGYTVKENLDYLLETYASDETLVRLVKDIIAYGGAAQSFTGHNKDNPVDADNEGASNAIPEATDKTLVQNEYDANNYFKSASVFFDTDNKIIVKFMATEGAKLVVKVDGIAVATVDAISGENVFFTEGIAATEFDKIFTFELQNSDGITVQTVTYSVNSYCYSMKDSDNDEMKALAIALYNYGVSSKAYKA